MVNGQGVPKSKEFQEAIQALYGITFTIKFTLKFAKIGPEYTVPPLDGLWWMKDGKPFNIKKKKDWLWTLMIMQPKHITKKHLTDAIKTIREKDKKKKRKSSPALDKVELKPFDEGLCVQIMHIGPYSAEKPTIEKMHRFAQEKGYKFQGKHHEIYLSDPRRTKSEKLCTVLRHPIKNNLRNIKRNNE